MTARGEAARAVHDSGKCDVCQNGDLPAKV